MAAHDRRSFDRAEKLLNQGDLNIREIGREWRAVVEDRLADGQGSDIGIF
jgi:hypothetical protein